VEKQVIGGLSARPSSQRPDIGVSGGGKQERSSGTQPEYLNCGVEGRGGGIYKKKVFDFKNHVIKTN